ncbi:MAG: hypothetical protein L6V35_09965 [Alistipes putredinis]|nr:MAG: hypothetical protein L6V35_09965 [Alistipes putredinis]
MPRSPTQGSPPCISAATRTIRSSASNSRHRSSNRLKTQPLSARQLSMAKRQFIGQMAVSMDSNESYMLGVGKSFLVYGEVDEMPAICSKIKAITSQQLTDIAADVFKDVSTLIYT